MRILATLGLLASVAGAQGSFDDAKAAYEAKDFAKALTGFRELAEQGNASAQDMYAHMLRSGQGTAVDDKVSVAWFQKAAAQGYAPAMRNLAEMTIAGRGIAKDVESGAAWMIKAADAGDVFGQAYAGMFYAQGQGVERDPLRSRHYLMKAARGGHPGGMFMLGQLLASGQTGKRDLNGAIEWFGRSARAGHEEGMKFVRQMATNDRHPIACYALAVMHFEGKHVVKDVEKAKGLLGIAVRANYAEAHWYMGELCLVGHAFEKDEQRANGHFARAAVRGSAAGQYRHALFTMQARPSPFERSPKAEAMRYMLLSAKQEYAPAIEWLQKASGEGDVDAMLTLARILPKAKMVALLERAAAAGSVNAMNMLGHAGVGAGEYEEGVAWFKQAAGKGHQDSAIWLARDAEKGKRLQEAYSWWSKVDTPDGHYEVGVCLELGKGVEANPAEAALHFVVAGLADHARALHHLAKHVALLSGEHRAAVIRHAGEIRKRYAGRGRRTGQEARRERVLDRCAAILGDEPSMVAHGIRLSSGNKPGAPEFLKPPAENGNASAMYWLGYAYGHSRQLELSFKWYRKAVDAGQIGAIRKVAKLCARGLGTAKDPVEARAWATALRLVAPRERPTHEWQKWYRDLGRELGLKKAEADARGKAYAEKLLPGR